jgi:hypothetical protein
MAWMEAGHCKYTHLVKARRVHHTSGLLRASLRYSPQQQRRVAGRGVITASTLQQGKPSLQHRPRQGWQSGDHPHTAELHCCQET